MLRRRDHRLTGPLTAACLALAMGGAVAQQSAQTEPPDYAAVLGSPQVVADPATGKRRGLTQQDIQHRLDAEGVRRTPELRRQSQALNRAIHAMPETMRDAQRQARPNAKGIVLIRHSREEIQPIMGIVGPDGSLRASHDPADLAGGSDRHEGQP